MKVTTYYQVIEKTNFGNFPEIVKSVQHKNRLQPPNQCNESYHFTSLVGHLVIHTKSLGEGWLLE